MLRRRAGLGLSQSNCLAPGSSSVITAQPPVIPSSLLAFPRNYEGAKLRGRTQVPANAKSFAIIVGAPRPGAVFLLPFPSAFSFFVFLLRFPSAF
jgi:hypothetical protein